MSAGSKHDIWGVFGAFSGRFGSVQFVCSHQERFTGIWLPDKAGLTQTARCSVSKPAQFLPSTSGLETFKVQFPKYFGLFAATRPCCRPQAFPVPPTAVEKTQLGSWRLHFPGLGIEFLGKFLDVCLRLFCHRRSSLGKVIFGRLFWEIGRRLGEGLSFYGETTELCPSYQWF